MQFDTGLLLVCNYAIKDKDTWKVSLSFMLLLSVLQTGLPVSMKIHALFLEKPKLGCTGMMIIR